MIRTMKPGQALPPADPGDTVELTEGVYSRLYLFRGGAPGLYVTYRAKPGHRVQVIGGVQIGADWVRVSGLEVSKSKESGIFGLNVHHAVVTDCKSFDNRGGGVFFGQSEWLDIRRNEVWGNCIASANSGISCLKMRRHTSNFDTGAYRLIIKDNHSHHNRAIDGPHTDANGLMLDKISFEGWAFPILVEGNLSEFNGGDGLMNYRSEAPTLIIRNTCRRNGWDEVATGPRVEFHNRSSSNSEWHDNIGIADQRIHPQCTPYLNGVDWERAAAGYVNEDVTGSGNTWRIIAA